MDNEKNNVTYIGKYTQDASKISVIDMLRDSIEDVKSGNRRECRKAIVIFLDDTENGQYDAGFNQAGMKVSEMIALIEYIKHDLLDSMVHCGD